jgi:hypothetical protein
MADRDQIKKAKPSAVGRKAAVSSGGVKRGREVWHVTYDGRRRTLETSSTSVTVMNDAMDIYSGALKRLAKK